MHDPAPCRWKPSWQAALVLAAVLSTGTAELAAQQAVVAVEENFRSEPNGTILGRLESGTHLTVSERDGNWARVTLEGFVWTASMQVREEGAFDLTISEPDGEAIRDEPSGRVAGTLSSGTLLEEIERIPGWVRVRRTGWMWIPSLEVTEVAEEDEGPDRVAPSTERTTQERMEGGTDVRGDEEGTWVRVRAREMELRSEPDGRPVGRVLAAADVQVLSEEGEWARVRLEGWVWTPNLTAGPDEEADILRDVRVGDFAGEPDRYRGRLVELELQFISMETAEPLRSDFFPGEPFLLTRSVEGAREFVYLAVAPERRGEMEALTPLETIRVLGRVRSSAAVFTGNPILDLLEVERVR